MKILNYTIIIKLKLLSIITIIMLTQSCSKENNNSQSYNPRNYYFYLTAAQLNQTPYFTNKAFDTISFASDKGDTLTFIKTKTDTSWYCERTTSNPDNNDQNCYQTLHNTYTTIKGNGSFDVKHSLRERNLSINRLDISFNDKIFMISSDDIGVKNPKYYIEELVINGKSYKGITKGATSKYNIYLNNKYGLFRMEYFIDTINWLFYEK